jgi:hypothetical protein
MKHHLTHVLMCLPILIVAGIAVVVGANPAFLLMAVMCLLMMAPMMLGGGHGGDDHDDRS